MVEPAGVLYLNEVLASAGGGGSGGGGGGGGGSGIGLLTFALGYLPMHALGWRLRKAHHGRWEADVLHVGGWIICVAYASLWGSMLLAVHSVGFGGVFFGLSVAALAVVGFGAGLYDWFNKIGPSRKTTLALQAAEAHDTAWNAESIIQHVEDVFIRYQEDWSHNDAAPMRAYMTPHYFQHASLMIEALKAADRRNDMQSVVIKEAEIDGVFDAADNSQDTVIVGFEANAMDRIVTISDGRVLGHDPGTFTEFWRFVRSGNTWLLDGIQPATANHWKSNPDLEQFAAANGYFYSLDWGYLLLPEHGQLFGAGKFGTSDINNHVIGLYNDVIIQLYTYSPTPGTSSDKYLIAQASLPRSYGDILVRHKQGLHLFGVKGLREVSTEWPDFNKKFQVYATTPEQATSLELLEPVYMEQLDAAPFEVNVEVVDNVVYLYAPLAQAAGASQYQSMLQLLHRAFQSMRI